MSDVTVIGLGAMGSALAGAFLDSGHSVTVWNRTEHKARPLVAKGASFAETPAKAIAASEMIVVCVDNYDVFLQVIDTNECSRCMDGKTIINLSTGNPHEARKVELHLKSLGASYLDGAILAYPEGIGSRETVVLISGAEASFKKSEALLGNLAGGITFVGAGVGNASALDVAALSAVMGLYIGLLHGIAICETESLPVAEFGQMVAEQMPVAAMGVGHLSQRIASNSFGETQAALKTFAAVARRLLIQAKTSGISASFPEFATDMLALGESSGMGGQDLAALISVFRKQRA
jgi:3-hydroxyisobutyrate dehydrogenase-like beta-hydroxyacid dehydrogenase